MIPTHRTCKKCGVTKLLSEFGVRRSNPDNLDKICKSCRRENSMRYGKQWVQQEPWSTKEARKLLTMNHIPCVTGRAAGLPKIDLMAWACVPIEAKASKPTYFNASGTCGFEFGFSRTQYGKGVPGLIVFFMRYDDTRYRWFVVPGNSAIVVGKTSFTVTLDSRLSKVWTRLQEYENRLDLIEEMRQQYIETGLANEYRPRIKRKTA